MRQQLKEISETSILLGDFAFPEALVQKKWRGNERATDHEIAEAESRLRLSLPDDYKQFLKLCNGFHAPNGVEPTFLSSDKIEYLERVDPDLTMIWTETGNIEIGKELKRSILVAGLGEEQYFLLVPPKDQDTAWQYWKFASWIPGQHEFDNLTSYWSDVLEFNKEQLKEK